MGCKGIQKLKQGVNELTVTEFQLRVGLKVDLVSYLGDSQSDSKQIIIVFY